MIRGQWFHNISIRWKISLAMLITSAISLVVLATAFIFYDRHSQYNNIIIESQYEASIIASNSTAAISFNDTQAANKTLAALQANPYITDAGIYRSNGEFFARYQNGGKDNQAAPQLRSTGIYRKGDHVSIYDNIYLDGEKIGTVYISTDLRLLSERFHTILLISIVFIIISIALAFIIAYFLQRKITKPVIALTEVSKKLIDERDYSVRAIAQSSNDEIGILIGTFNRMIEQIENDAELHKYKQQLEDLIQARTKELEETQNQLVQSQKMDAVGKLAGGIAHDFNNLLGAMMGFASLLKDELPKDSDEASMTDKILQAANRAADLTQQLLGFARKGQYQPKKVNANAIILEAKALLERSLEKSIIIETALAEDSKLIKADSTQLQQIIMNLGINARDAMSEGGVITITSENITLTPNECLNNPELKPGIYVRIKVQDTGTGIPQEIIDKIFDPFFTTKEIGKGTGLGLAMVHGIVKNHGGLITIDTSEGKGTTFNLYFLPFTSPGNESVSNESTQFIEEIIDLAGKTVLIVDDEELIREVISRTLKPLQVDCLFAANGEEAIEVFKEHHKDISFIFMDVMMPVMDGTKAFRGIQKVNPDIKVIFMTGYTESKKIQGLIDLNNVKLIQKPFEKATLLKEVYNFIE